jgi:hypothetical protein
VTAERGDHPVTSSRSAESASCAMSGDFDAAPLLPSRTGCPCRQLMVGMIYFLGPRLVPSHMSPRLPAGFRDTRRMGPVLGAREGDSGRGKPSRGQEDHGGWSPSTGGELASPGTALREVGDYRSMVAVAEGLRI